MTSYYSALSWRYIHDGSIYIVYHDLSGKILFANQAFLNTFGCTHNLNDVTEFFDASDSFVKADYFNMVKLFGQSKGQIALMGREGKINLHFKCSLRNGKVMLIAWPLPENESRNDSPEKFFEQILQNSPDVMMVIDKSETVRYINRRMMQWLTGRTITSILDNNQADLFRKKLRSARPGCPSRVEFKLQNEDFECRFVYLHNDAILSQVSNITIRKKFESEIRKLSLIAKNTTNSVIITNEKGVLTWTNDAFTRITGYSIEESIGKTLSFLQGPESSPETIQYIRHHTRNKMPFSCDIVNYKKTGEKFWFHIQAQPVFNDDESLLYYFAIQRDITKTKEMQATLINARDKAEESERLKSSFLANMSHEIRTPLNAILGFSELIANSNTSADKKKEFVRLARIKANNLLEIINNILEVSRIETGQWQIHESVQNLETWLREFFTEFQLESNFLSKKSLDYILRIELPDSSSVVSTDFNLLKHVLSNLLGNAQKFTEEGFISLHCREQSEGEYLFSVRDTGIGITPAQQKIIFDAFRQADDSVQRRYGGTGLGLFLCQKLVHLAGGNIWVESEEGHGAMFCFTLPMKKVNQLEIPYNQKLGILKT